MKTRAKCICLVVISVWLDGCGHLPVYRPEEIAFRNVYEQLRASTLEIEKAESESGLITTSVHDQPVLDFIRWLSSKTGSSIVVSDTLDNKRLSLEFNRVPLVDVLASLGRRVGAEVTTVGGVYFIGELRPEDRGYLVAKVGAVSKEDLNGIIRTQLSEFGRVISLNQGVAVVGDKIDILKRIDQMLAELQELPSVVWVVQLLFIKHNISAIREVSLDGGASVDLSWTFAEGSQNGGDVGGAFSSLLTAQLSSGQSELELAPLVLCKDGSVSEWRVGERFPVPRKVITESGVIETVGFDYVSSGFGLTVSVRDLGGNKGELNVHLESSSVLDFTDGAPTFATDSLKVVTDVTSGGYYVLGTLTQKTKSNLLRSLVGFRSQEDLDRIEIWARVYKIAGSMKG